VKAVQRFFRNLFARVGIAGGLLTFFWRRKIWWMIPLAGALLILGVLVIFGQSSAISAFIYTLF
jgi:presenilin-like A22 family membrane protease